jgi:hypothetical protein
MRPKRNIYRTEVTHGMRLYTTYEGTSREKATQFAEVVRAAIIISSGTATVILRVNEVADVVYSITNGEAFLALIGGADSSAKKAS